MATQWRHTSRGILFREQWRHSGDVLHAAYYVEDSGDTGDVLHAVYYLDDSGDTGDVLHAAYYLENSGDTLATYFTRLTM